MDGAATNWPMWEVIAIAVGAIGQIATAIILLAFTNRSNRVTGIKHLSDMVNEWNRLVVATEPNRAALSGLRPPVVDGHTDTIVFSYLNFLRTGFEMHNARIIPTDHERAMMRNGVAWLAALGRDKIDQYLSRGYDGPFRQRLMSEFEVACR